MVGYTISLIMERLMQRLIKFVFENSVRSEAKHGYSIRKQLKELIQLRQNIVVMHFDR